MDRYIRRQIVPTFFEADDVYLVYLRCKFCYPCMEETEHLIVKIDGLRRDK
jgi:hypothetical protein